MSKVNDLKQENEIKIRECLYDGQIWTKNDLAYKTSLSLATTTNILQEMLKSHEIEYVSDSKSTGGRKSKEYQLYKDYKHLLKIVLKKNKKSYEFIFEIIDLYDQIVYQKNYSSLKGTVEEFLKIIKEVLKKDQEIAVICLSLSGVCDQGMIDLCDFEDFQNKNILEILKKEIKQKIIVDDRLKELIKESCDQLNVEIIEMEIMPDHVHLLLEVDPQYGIHKAVKRIKGYSSRVLRQEFSWLKSRIPTLWTNSYFVSTVGGAPLSVIKQYIEDQKNV